MEIFLEPKYEVQVKEFCVKTTPRDHTSGICDKSGIDRGILYANTVGKEQKQLSI